jgi:type IV secretory pathway VirB10-like protein
LAIVCVFPFLFSTLSNNDDPLGHQTIVTRTPGKALRYEAASAVEDKNKAAPVRKPKQKQPAPQQQEKSAKTTSDTTRNNKAAPAAAEHKAVPTAVETEKKSAAATPKSAVSASAAAAKKPPAPAAAKRNAGFIVVEASDPIKKVLVAHRQDSDIHIYMDWALPAERFSLLNYRSLESVLTQYPNAKVRTLVVAPFRATHYNYANTLSYMQF